jgi:hypothetical protein
MPKAVSKLLLMLPVTGEEAKRSQSRGLIILFARL